MKVDIYLPVWFVANTYSIEVDLFRTWRCVDTWIVLKMLISDWDTLPQKNIMKTSTSFVLASEVCTATARALVQEKAIDWLEPMFVCGIDELKSVQFTKLLARKGKARQYLSYSFLHHAFPYLPSATTVTPNELENASIMP